MTLELLVAAQDVAASTPEDGLPTNRLRLTLEYPQIPDLEAQRVELARILGGDNFVLEPLDPLLPQFLVLQFPGVERRMSPQSQFAAADALVDELDLVSATPDVGTALVLPPDDPAQVEGVKDLVLGATCWVKEDRLANDWAVKAMNIPAVWAKGLTGRGVRVAQPDSGVAQHFELNGALDLSLAFNTLNNTDQAFDPLSDDMGNPGHGTATASVVASRGAGDVMGAAPGAKVVPIRCLDSVIHTIDGSSIARAILHAVRIKADVISMSLGGGFSRSIRAALQKAAAEGIICIAAAGNCVQPIVVYPASDKNTLAMAGTNHRDKPWKGSSRGRRVSLSAPAENVLVARRTPNDGGAEIVKPSQGTSFAVALTAGVAALWVEKHGRTKIKAEATRLSVSVNQLFKVVLKQTSRRPAGWPRGMGSGIVDADAAIEFNLATIQSIGTPEAAPEPSDDLLIAALDDTYDNIETSFEDWPRISAETVFLLSDAWIRRDRAAGIAVETPSRPGPSTGLARRLPEQVKAALAEETASFSPPLISGDVKKSTAPNYAKLLASGPHGTAESSASMSTAQAVERLKSNHADNVLAQAESAFNAIAAKGLGDRNTQAEVLANAKSVIAAVAEGRTEDLDTGQRATLEALVQITDRPAYRVNGGTIDPDDPLFGEWGGFLSLIVDLPRWANSVGRINLDGVHQGTGFLMGGGQIMTNRHVLEACADEVTGPGGSSWRFDRGAITIDFSDTADGSKEFELNAVTKAGARPIGGIENLNNLDAAILSLDATQSGLPKALPFARSVDTDADMIVIGYPARPGTSAFIDPATGQPSLEIAHRLRAIFGTDYGRKYVSPGRILDGPGALAGDTKDWALSHDCTTLGGSSGSVVVQLSASPAVAGLHFSGATLSANKAHALGAVNGSTSGPLPDAIWI